MQIIQCGTIKGVGYFISVPLLGSVSWHSSQSLTPRLSGSDKPRVRACLCWFDKSPQGAGAQRCAACASSRFLSEYWLFALLVGRGRSRPGPVSTVRRSRALALAFLVSRSRSRSAIRDRREPLLHELQFRCREWRVFVSEFALQRRCCRRGRRRTCFG